MLKRTAKSCGPDASTPASSFAEASRPNRVFDKTISGSDGDKQARSPGRARRKPLKPLRAGMPGESGGPVVTTLVCSLHILHARLRVRRASGIPHALCWANASCTPRAHRAAASRSHIELEREKVSNLLDRSLYIHNSRYMESEDTILALAALAQPTRLDVFRLLLKHEPDGLAAGDIARALTVPQNTMSAHLSILSRAGL